MGSSDSETESECFESAEESFDDEEEKKRENRKLNNLLKNDKEASEHVSDFRTVNAIREIEADTSNSSLSYRKRPERVKRTPSKTQAKPNSKSPTNELIFRTDKIVPDVFLQDITSNLSKNFNKSLSSLQQKSSNVKDMILNSLPVSAVDNNEGFCYDDKNTCCIDDNVTLEHEECHPSNNQSAKFQEDIIDENIINKKEITEDILPNPESDFLNREKETDINCESKVEDTGNTNLENDSLVENITEDDNLDSRYSGKCSGSSIGSDLQQMSEGNICTETINFISNKQEEIIQESDEEVLNHENSKISDKEKPNSCSENFNKTGDINLTEPLNQDIEICKEKISIKPSLNVESKEQEVIHEISDTSELVESDFVQNNEGLADIKEICADQVIKEKTKIDSECNLEELKTVLKNIFKEENILTKERENLEEQQEVQSSGDGWDDFDFSDDEVESSNVEDNYKTKQLEDIEIKDIKKHESPNPVLKSSSDETKRNQSNSLVDNKKNSEITSLSKKTTAEKAITKGQEVKGAFKETERAKNSPQNKIVENDSWDWDNWDENDEVEEVEDTSVKNFETKKDKNNSQDVSNWSGWDTFGQKPQEKQDNWGLGSWGVDALLNKATAVTQGISSVLEAGLGAPDPETLARMEKLQRENLPGPEKEVINNTNENPGEISKKSSLTNVNIFPVSGITSLVAGVTSKIVEHSKIQEIGSKVITGGLETLETFGKKTMEVLQEGDPGLKNKRALLLGNNKPVLSQVLREAREKADRESKKAEEKELAKKCHFETLFDDFQGMVHLEALEMLSRQCELKLDQIRSGMNSEEQEDLNGILEEVEQLCTLDEYDIDMKSSMLDFKTLLQMAVEPLKNEISIQNIVQIHEDVNKWLQTSSEIEPSFTVINQKLVSTLAELTAATVHQFHKSGELLSVKECRKTVEEVDALSRLTNALCIEINKLGEKFIKLSSNKVSRNDSGDSVTSVNEKVNNVMKNSVFYIKQAFNLLIPVVQLGAAV